MAKPEEAAPTTGEVEKKQPRVLTRTQIFAAKDIEYEYVKVPEWGKEAMVRVKTLAADERDALETSCVDADGNRSMEGMRAKAVAMTAVDEKGELLFSLDDAKTLGKKSARAMERIFDVGYRLAGMGPESLKAAVKNSGEGQNDSSSSD